MKQNSDGVECQKIFSRAIQQYTERHNIEVGETGSKDLQTLSSCNPPNLIKIFGSSLSAGLTTEQVNLNSKEYGFNEYKKRKKQTLFQIFKEAISDQMLIILMVAAVVSIVVQYLSSDKDKDLFWVDGVSILIAVLICTLVATFSNYQKQKQFDELDQMTENTFKIQVIRDGKRQQIHRSKIVPGDIIYISNGLEVPADCILYEGVNVIVNESAITGQSQELEKNIFQKCEEQRMDPKGPTPLMISGSSVVCGEGLMMAVVVGKQSRAGKNYELIFSKQEQEEEQKTPLELQLQNLANQIGHFGLTSAMLIFVILFVRLLIEQLQQGGFDLKQNLQNIVSYLIIAVTVIVVAIPEGLPLAVTLTLAYSMKAMYEDKILVRKLASCETMGAARFICSDKTGTITQNKMNVVHFINVKGMSIGQFQAKKLHKDFIEKLTNAIFHNTAAIVELEEKGSQTQIALLKMIRKLTGKNEIQIRKQIGPDGYFKRLPFDSSRKRMTTGIRVGDQDIIFMNGASEQILQACSSIQNYEKDQIVQIDKKIKEKIYNELQDMASRGLRTVSVAYKVVNIKNLQIQKKLDRQEEVLEEVQKSGFTLLGIFGIEDPPRGESKDAIADCKRAGIKVLMVTGDNKITASNIAKQVGIIENEKQAGKVMEAGQLMKKLENKGLLKSQQQIKIDKKVKSEKENQSSIQSSFEAPGFNKLKKIVLENEKDEKVFEQIINNLAVMARSKPEHKYILVDGINKLGHIVGVTGDGANDAPALMRADIGLAMGITGTQVSKNASDIILLDDNFNSIVRAVVWGRNVYLSIRKFLQFQLTANVIAVCITLISAAVIRQSIFVAVQMLWVNLIMDSLAALALATEPPNREQLLNQQPNSPEEILVTKTMFKHIIGQAICQLIILLLLLFLGPSLIPQYKDAFDDVIGKDLEAKYYKGISEGTVADGKFYTISGEDNYISWFRQYHNNSRHFTFIFNTFVFLQVFNFICCRRIKDELNFFSNICASKLFWIIVGIIVVLQVLIITFGGRFFQIYSYHGLTGVQWTLSVGIGALTMPVSIMLRLLPFAKPQKGQYSRKAGSHFNKKTGYYEPIK